MGCHLPTLKFSVLHFCVAMQCTDQKARQGANTCIQGNGDPIEQRCKMRNECLTKLGRPKCETSESAPQAWVPCEAPGSSV